MMKNQLAGLMKQAQYAPLQVWQQALTLFGMPQAEDTSDLSLRRMRKEFSVSATGGQMALTSPWVN